MTKSIIIAMTLILQFFSCDARICIEGERPAKYQKLCNLNIIETNYGSLPCKETVCEINRSWCELSGRNVSQTIMNFTPHMCVTDETSSPRYAGLMFNWTRPAGQTNITGLKVLIHHNDYPEKWILLYVNLTRTLEDEDEKVFSTDCLASNNISPGKNYFISVQVVRKEETGELYKFQQPFTYNPNCSRPRPQERSLCAAPPSYRPRTIPFCNGTVAVIVDSGFPPGIREDTKEFKVEVVLHGPHYYESVNITQEVASAKSTKRVVYFDNLEPGIYEAKVAFLDEEDLPCLNNYYRQEHNTILKKPPTINLRIDHPRVCKGEVIEVTIIANSDKSNPDHRFNITVILSGVQYDQQITKRVLVTMDSKTFSNITKIPISNVPSGNYTVSTKFENDYYSKCSSDEAQELTVNDCPRPLSGPKRDAFWTFFGPSISVVGMFSILLGVLAFLIHQRWLKLKRNEDEQQNSLVEDLNMHDERESSIADTTVQESHLHRFLNDTGRGWSSQVDCTTTELDHIPMAGDLYVTPNEYETQSWQENDSVAFSI